VVPDCCDPAPYRDLFNEKQAERRLRTYRRKGLDPMAAGLVRYLTERGVSDKTVLEVGGGVGDLHVELLKAGAGSCVNVELSDGYEAAAATLLAGEGLTGKVDRRLGDFVEEADLVEPSDIVVLNRVICCYPWMERMVDAATAKTRSLLAITVPRDGVIGHVFVGVARLVNRLRGCDFRPYLHSVTAVEARIGDAGLDRVYSNSSVVWDGMVFERV
jgi:magnesium-protoporphyrin O-methyltransferase